MSARNRVVVDERERASGVPDLLRELGLMVDHRMLEVGDYIVPGYAVERKEIGDFLRSLYSRRIFDQAYRLAEIYENAVLVVEGDIAPLLGRKIGHRAYWGALLALTFDYGLKVFFTTDETQTANLIYTLRMKRPLKLVGPVVRKKPKAEDTERMQLQIVTHLPGIGTKLADRILREFRTVRNVFGASTAELSAVRGVGKVTAYRISRLLDAPYRPFLKRPQQLRLEDADPKGLKA
ncbi:MAG: helix-hairpin-helix domain-containing protein [Candidatus Bathyarchaeota archaeon]|nr:helix-hairpin-helix domain-containing protein [Candidatus Bathyarchaeota archaeon]